MAAFEAASKGGGPRFELITLDDGGQTERCAQNVSTLLGSKAARNAMKVATVGKRSMKDALSTLRADLGGYTVQFSPGSTQGSKYVKLVTMDRYGRLVG